MRTSQKIVNEMQLTFKSRSANEGFARTAVAAFVAGLDPTVDELADIKTAVSEAVTNCIVHGYRDTIANIYITARIYDDNRIVVKIRDRGCGIDDIEKAMEPMYTTCPGGERAGLGFAVMQSMCEKVRVTSKPGKGTIVTLTTRIASRDE
ncbi:anti-sigma F factor [Ruminococcaceae bacterium OttesenSCG-928-L11]|nr:anti-sigma F factor [Ruminococcaceae bacterium OttesenSCG-928-L11]